MNNLNLNDEAVDEEPDDEALNELSGVELADEYGDDDDEPDDEEADGEDPISAAWGYGDSNARRG